LFIFTLNNSPKTDLSAIPRILFKVTITTISKHLSNFHNPNKQYIFLYCFKFSISQFFYSNGFKIQRITIAIIYFYIKTAADKMPAAV